MKRPLALVIIDGWGYSPKREGNAIALAKTPFYDEICEKFPMTLLAASGERVGLPAGTAGSSEVGHLNIGAGRVIRTDLARIDFDIESNNFFDNKVLTETMQAVKSRGANLHLVGLLSDGKVHSSQEHLFALLRMAKKQGLNGNVFVHATLDGRDTVLTADIYVEALEIKMADIGCGRVATLCGRHYTMDKSQNWERTARAFTMLVHAEGERAFDAMSSIRGAYLRGLSDEFIPPIVLESSPNTPVATVQDGDAVVFFNFRADRMKQLSKVFAFDDFDEFTALSKPKVEVVCLTEYDKNYKLPIAFPNIREANVLAEVFAQNGILNCRLTETEKYAHVTYFFNGGNDTEHTCEHRSLVPSPKISSYEIEPEMASFKVTDRLLRGLEAGENDVFIVNLAAPDMVAHTGSLEKTIEAVQFVDTCLGGILKTIREHNCLAIITSDHGNCEEMIEENTGQPNPAHTTNPVPFHFVDVRANGVKLRTDGALEDIAPTILGILNLEKPAEMSGNDLRK